MKSLWNAIAILGVLVTVSFGQVPTRGLVALYDFSGDFNDKSGSGINLQQAQIFGAILCPDRHDSANSAVNIRQNPLKTKDSLLPMGNSARTISMWANIAPVSTPQTLISYGTKENGKEFKIQIEGKYTGPGDSWIRVINNLDTASTYFCQSSQCGDRSIVRGTWTHIAIAYANNLATFYIGGKYITQDTLNFCNTQPTIFYVGGCYLNASVATYLYGGKIDDISIYSRALDSNEIKYLYNCTAYKNRPPTFTSTPQALAQTSLPYNYQVITSDANTGDVVTLSLVAKPTGMTLASGTIAWTPSDTGTYHVSIAASDKARDTTYQNFDIHVEHTTSVISPIKMSIKNNQTHIFYSAQGRVTQHRIVCGNYFSSELKKLVIK